MLQLEGQALDEYLVEPSVNVRTAVTVLEQTGKGICLVVSTDKRKLIGTITDGDVRRLLLKQGSLDLKASEISNPKPVSAPSGYGLRQYEEICQVNKIRHLPLLGQGRQLEGLFLLHSDGGEANDCRLVIMAGGKGTRLKPLTDNCPKPLLEIGGRPILERIIEKARKEGIKKISITVNYLKDMIIDCIGDGERLGVEVEYIEESKPLGTAGGLIDLKGSEKTILVTNGDVITDISYTDVLAFHNMNGAEATMAVKSYEWASPYGVVEVEGIEMISIREKPIYREYVNAGIYAIERRQIAKHIQGEYCDMPTLFQRIRQGNGRTIAYPMHEPWIDIGRHEELDQARKKLSS